MRTEEKYISDLRAEDRAKNYEAKHMGQKHPIEDTSYIEPSIKAEIYDKYLKGETYIELHKEYNIPESTLIDIVYQRGK